MPPIYLRVLTFALMALVAVAVTAACRVELAITVHEDGAGEISQTVASDTELMAELLGEFFDPEDMIDEMTEDVEGFEPHPYEQGKFIGVRYTGSFDANDVDTLHAKLDALAGATENSAMLEDLSLSREGPGWRFSATAPPMSDSTGSEFGDDFSAALAAGLLDDASFEVKVTLPGDSLEHNADRVDDGTLVWEIGLVQTEPRSLTALTGEDETDVGDVIAGMVFLIVVIAAIGGLAWLVLRRWRGSRSRRPV